MDFDDSRNYEVVRRKLLRVGNEGEALVNMGIFMLSGTLAACMQEIFGDFLAKRTGKFNSDELWQLWASPDASDAHSRRFYAFCIFCIFGACVAARACLRVKEACASH
nr:hypothetical protein [Methanophagales archaeon]